MERKVGTIARGIRCPIIREGDDLSSIVVNSVLEAAEQEGFALRDRDVVAVTESIVARAQGNYAAVAAVAAEARWRNHWGDFPYSVPQPLRHLSAGYRAGSEKGGPDAQLSQ